MENRIRELIKPGQALVTWVGRDRDIHRYCILRCVYMLTVRYVNDDILIESVPGALVRSGDGKKHVRFTNKGIVRIVSGTRKNMTVMLEDVRLGEEAKPAVAQINLRKTAKADDGLIGGILRDIASVLEEPVASINNLVVPEFYIRSKTPQDMRPRLDGATLQLLKGLYGDEFGCMDERDIYQKVWDKLCKEHDGGFYLCPLRNVFGPGLVLADIDGIIPAIVPEDQLSTQVGVAEVRVC
jgi:hypothetical protein